VLAPDAVRDDDETVRLEHEVAVAWAARSVGGSRQNLDTLRVANPPASDIESVDRKCVHDR